MNRFHIRLLFIVTLEILVFEDGAPRTVLKAEPLRPGGGSFPWSLVLYFDQALTGPVTARPGPTTAPRRYTS